MDFELSKIAEAYELQNSGFIEPTVEWMGEKFVKFNKEMFDGKLPDVKFETVTKSNLIIGESNVNVIPSSGKIYSDTIRINRNFYIRESVLEDILIHEMIHLENTTLYPDEVASIIINNKGDDNAIQNCLHSTKTFVSEMNRINTEFNRDITIKSRIYDRTKFLPAKNAKDEIMEELNDIIFFCIYDGGPVIAFKLSKTKNTDMIDFLNKTVEKGKLSSEIFTPISDKAIYIEYSSSQNNFLKFENMQKFNEFKKDMMTVNESKIIDENDGNNDNMPDVIIAAKQSGLPVEYKDGAWEITIS